MHIGAMVRCIHPDGRMLARDKLYAVLARDGDWVIVQDDWGRKGRFPMARFRLEAQPDSVPPPASKAWPDHGRKAPSLSILRSTAPLRRRP